jgi:hypothetical protein
MIKFLDGPASAVVLDLKRAPRYLRVVRSNRGNFDALDQLDDSPKLTEQIFVYKMAEWHGVYHLRCSRRSASGFYPRADYRLNAEQPAEPVLRDTQQWRDWCMAQPEVTPASKERSDGDQN